MPLLDDVETALAVTPTEPRDGATVALVRYYAAAIDEGTRNGLTGAVDVLRELGPKLLAALEALQMSPRARAALVKGDTSGPAANPLDQLRARRAARTGTDGA